MCLMPRDPLRVLATLRRFAVDAARQELAKHENFQRALASHIDACNQTIAANDLAACGSDTKVEFIGPIHKYVENLQRRAHMLREHVPVAERKSDAARAALSQARLAEKAVEQVSLRRDQARRVEAERRAQHVLDDIVRLVRPSAGQGPE